jgi:hypothetical protein
VVLVSRQTTGKQCRQDCTVQVGTPFVGQGYQDACAAVKRMEMMGRPYQVAGPLSDSPKGRAKNDRALDIDAVGGESLVGIPVTLHATRARNPAIARRRTQG